MDRLGQLQKVVLTPFLSKPHLVRTEAGGVRYLPKCAVLTNPLRESGCGVIGQQNSKKVLVGSIWHSVLR